VTRMSSGQVLSFLRRPASCDWTQQELAEFYRVEDALHQGGFAITTDRGVTDEGDPWFVVCRADNEEVIAHFARIDREYIIASNLSPGATRGRDFRALVRGMLESHPLTLPIRRNQGQKVLLHPATLLVALLATAYIISSEKELVTDGHVKSASIASLLMEKFAIFAAAILAATWLENKADWALNAFEKGPLHQLFHDDKAAVAAAHDVAPLDSISQHSALAFGGHHGSQTNQVLALNAKAGDTPAQASASKAINCANPAHNPSENASDANTPPPDHSNNDQASAALAPDLHNDCTNVGLTNLQTAIVAGVIAAAAANGTASSQNAESPQGNSADNTILATDAYHVTASEISAFSTPTILLSTAPVPVNVALEQAFAQVGLSASSPGAALPFGDQASASGATTHLTSAVAAEPSANATLVTPPPAAPTEQAVVQEVTQFLESTPSVEVIFSGANMVFIDANVADAKSPNYGVTTFDMSDGSTLSIVGILPSHLHAVNA
jgi:hypothetical protein